ncbi:MAG: N-acetylmuramoyl-L-alanine amidase [Oscillospiraceae bacterium]|nr:N-acetylmuramoyl-L-alanine amidase [Oscillospiraceae bacterium]
MIEAHTDVPPTEPPTEPPTKPPIEVTPITCLEDLGTLELPSYVDDQIIEVDYHSRRGSKLKEINDIVIHYVGNPGTTAQQNRDWYADTLSNVSSHFVVGLQGEVIQCIPLDEASSASNHRNFDTISIEICHPDASGKFTDATYESVVELTAWLVKACDLEIENVIRHYEVTGKICPKYYVENEDAWVQLRADVAARVGQ